MKILKKDKAIEYLNNKYDMEYENGILTIRGSIHVIDFIFLKQLIKDKNIKDIRVI